MRRRRSAIDESFGDRYRMRPSIARMTLDLDYGELDYGDATQKIVSHSTRATEALQHRLVELLVFEIRQDGDTQFKNLSVRGLYKYVLRAVKISAERRRPIKPMSICSSPRESKSKKHPLRDDQRKAEKEDEFDDSKKDDSDTSDSDVDEKINNLHEALMGEKSICNTSNRNRLEEKSVSFVGLSESYSSNNSGVPLAIEQELHKSPHTSFDDMQQKSSDQGPKGGDHHVTYRERLGGFLHPRDLRRLVSPFSASNEPELIVRRHVMLLNFDPLRAVILRDRLLVLVPDGADSLLVDLEKRVRGGAREIERAVFGETATSNSLQSEVSNFESSNIGDSHHSDLADSAQSGSHKRPSPAPSTLQKVKHTLLHDKQTGSSAITSFGTETSQNENGSTLAETETFGNDTEFQEWEEMDSRVWVDLPFELQCLDAVLGSVCAILGKDSNELQANSIRAMDKLLYQGSGGEEILRHMKNSIKEMTQRVKGFIRAMNLVLDESEDMALMNLSRLLTHPERFIQPVPEEILNEESDEPELILEAHLQQAFSLTNSLDLVRGEIETTQELINQRLDAVRNRLLLANMIISIGSLCVAIGSFIGSLFGMNVINYLEDDPNAFKQIVVGTLIGMFGMLLLVGLGLWYAGTLPNLRSSF